MVNEQEKYIEFLNFAKSSIETTAASVSPLLDLISRNFSETLSDCEKNVEGAQLLVPITGMFSAGKSSLLNAFLGGCLLPVGISPETALATELHFDTHQRIEAINHTGAIEHFDFSSFGEISRRADEFEYLRVFVSSPALKNIQPLILVDMPGFDSPLDTHNKAILNFIDRGAHYVVLVSVEEGGLTRPVINRLQGILDNGRLFSLCLSKVDLRPPLQRAEVLQHIAEQLSANFGVTQEVVVFDQTSAGERLRKLIDDIDPNRLVRSLFSNTIKDIFLRLDADTNIVLTTLGKNAEEISKNQDELRAALAQLESEKAHQLEKLRERNEGSRQVQSVLNSVKQRLNECTEQLVQSAMSSQESLSQQVNEIVQVVLVGALRKAHGEVSSEAIMNFSRAMEGSIRTGFVLPPDMVTTLVENIKEPLTAAIFSKIGNASGNKSGEGGNGIGGGDSGADCICSWFRAFGRCSICNSSGNHGMARRLY